MNDSKIGVRYAKALFEVGVENNQLDAFRADIETIASVCNQNDIRLLLESPIVKPNKKQQLFTEIFKGKIQEISLNFLLMILANSRDKYIPAICRNFVDLYRKSKGIKAAKVTTASPISDDLKQKISNVIAEVFKAEVELSTAEEATLIGGFILRVGDQQVDASVSAKLNKIKREFLNKVV